MIRDIVHDPLFLGMPSMPATEEDLPVAADLLETLQANAERCVGMAANMIGEDKAIIVVNVGFMDLAMFNPVITGKAEPYPTVEGCLSLAGVRRTERFRSIEVTYRDINWKKVSNKFTGFTAQIIQHEVDHLSGILI